MDCVQSMDFTAVYTNRTEHTLDTNQKIGVLCIEAKF